jgi:hypothetical protein
MSRHSPGALGGRSSYLHLAVPYQVRLLSPLTSVYNRKAQCQWDFFQEKTNRKRWDRVKRRRTEDLLSAKDEMGITMDEGVYLGGVTSILTLALSSPYVIYH